MSGVIIYSPETMTYTLSNGTDRITLPNWARRVIRDEFENETRPLSNKIEILSDALALARDENAKLRELCVKALEWLRWAGGITCPPEVPDEFADELRELGVEVTA